MLITCFGDAPQEEEGEWESYIPESSQVKSLSLTASVSTINTAFFCGVGVDLQISELSTEIMPAQISMMPFNGSPFSSWV